MNRRPASDSTDKTSAQDADLIRLRHEYRKRREMSASLEASEPVEDGDGFIHRQRRLDLLEVLERENCLPLGDRLILEVGCGSGRVLSEFVSFGANPSNLFGIDLLEWRLNEAHAGIPESGLVNADGRYLPFANQSFDIVMQFTAFSSILNSDIRHRVSGEMMRVMKPRGLILWYDFWLNPTNRQTKGIRPGEIRDLFPGCHYSFRRITLAPPIARMLIPCSTKAGQSLERMRFLNTHYLAVIRLEEIA